MDNLLPENEYTEVEGRAYINPQTGIDETNTFIENLRATQGQQNQEIADQTYNLGTAVPSVQGGLGSPTDTGLAYFTSRYQTPMTNTTVANLRATAQAKALNDVLANEQAIWKERYNQAYRNYRKRARAKSSGGGGGGNNTPTTDDVQPNISQNTSTKEIGSANTEQIALSMYLKKMEEYRNAGLSPKEAEDRAQREMGLYGKTLTPSQKNPYSPENAALLINNIKKAAK